ncbi:hypothetical protein [Candidatus Harpocratesius sp.]
MLKDFFILEQSGIGIYEWHREVSEHQINFQLLSGLITVLIQFSKETLMDEMQVLELENGIMILTYEKKMKERFAVGIYDQGDGEIPAKKLNGKILKAFNEQYPKDEEKNSYLIEDFPISEITRGGKFPITLPRTKSIFILLALLLFGLTFSITYFVPTINSIYQYLMETKVINEQSYEYIIFIIIFPFFLTGLFAGTWKRAFWISFISILLIELAFYIIALMNGEKLFVGLLDLIGAFAMFSCAWGGFLSNRFFLNKHFPKKSQLVK